MKGWTGYFAIAPMSSWRGTCSGIRSKVSPKFALPPTRWSPFGRPKGDRGSYKQWVEGRHRARKSSFEILSPGNRVPEMERKLEFYERYGVEEYYIYDPDEIESSGW